MLHGLKAVLFVGSFLTLASSASAVLIHKYTFDSGPVAIDSVGGANGTLFGGAAIAGGVLSLNGTSAYAQTMGNHVVPTSGDFTVSLFATQTAFGPAHTELISQGASGSGFYIGYDPAHHFRITDAYTSTSIPFPADGQTHHYALAQSGSVAALYIDGVFQGNFPNIFAGPGGTDTRFGAQFVPAGEYFNGTIDNIEIYNHALSAVEIANIAAGPQPAFGVPASSEWGLLILAVSMGALFLYALSKLTPTQG